MLWFIFSLFGFFFFSVVKMTLKQKKIKDRFMHNRDGYFIERFVPGQIKVQSSPFFPYPFL